MHDSLIDCKLVSPPQVPLHAGEDRSQASRKSWSRERVRHRHSWHMAGSSQPSPGCSEAWRSETSGCGTKSTRPGVKGVWSHFSRSLCELLHHSDLSFFIYKWVWSPRLLLSELSTHWFQTTIFTLCGFFLGLGFKVLLLLLFILIVQV